MFAIKQHAISTLPFFTERLGRIREHCKEEPARGFIRGDEVLDKEYSNLYCLSKNLVETGTSIINYGTEIKKEGKDAYLQAETIRKNYIKEQKEQKESMKTASQPVFKGGRKSRRRKSRRRKSSRRKSSRRKSRKSRSRK